MGTRQRPVIHRHHHSPGDVLRSDCDQYLCRMRGWGARYEVWSRDGMTHWVNDDRYDRRADTTYPLPFMVGNYSAECYDQPWGTINLQLLQCDSAVKIVPWTGNTVLEARQVSFRRKLPRQQWPAWLKHYVQASPLETE